MASEAFCSSASRAGSNHSYEECTHTQRERERERERERVRGTKRRGAAIKGCGGHEFARLLGAKRERERERGGTWTVAAFFHWIPLSGRSFLPGHAVHAEQRIESGESASMIHEIRRGARGSES